MKQPEINEIERIIPLIGLYPSIIDGYMEGDIIEMLILLAKYQYNTEFEYMCKCISETTLETFRQANNYMLECIYNDKNNKFINIFNEHHILILTKYK
jgi:hypothetical protein